MSVKFSNNGHSTLAASLASNATSITVASGHGARFPSLSSGEYFYATLIDASNNLEIVKCTARSSDVLTVTRAQEGTTARAYAIGDRIELRITAQGLVDATDILPSQSGNSGKFLKTDGSTLSFDTAGSTSASDLTSGTLPSARLPAGTILQVISTPAGQSGNTINTTSYTAIGLEINITPKQSGSHFLYQCFWLVYDGGSNGTLKVESAMFRGSTNISGNLTHTPFDSTGDANRMPYGGITQIDTGASAVAGTQISYSYKFKKNSTGEQTYDVAHNDAKSAFLTIMEIAT